ncbi:MAG: gamma-glutamyl-gamma-aminobutyrate hydrolase PuuD [Colwellia sp.]|jgi:gamma-glutamyl-gamma-aminobutyrate hydrolase PuuD
MKLIGVTMRVDVHPDYGERRDALDQQWLIFFKACDLTPIFMPNSLELMTSYLELFQFSGFVLSGGNSPVEYGGDAPERDEIDRYLIDWSIKNNKPILGVCRGMQSIQQAYDHCLDNVDGHVVKQQKILINGQQKIVNSYHKLATKTCLLPLKPWAVSVDGVIKAVKHQNEKVYGIMWHPERNDPLVQQDIKFFKKIFS